MRPIFLFLSLGTPEIIVLGMVGLLLFGRRLPEVGRSLGKSFLEFKSGLNDMKSELTDVQRMVEKQESYDPVPRPEVKDVTPETNEAPSDEDDASKDSES